MTPYTQLRASRPRLTPEEMLSLNAPLSVFVEPTNVCNFACPVCPQSSPDFEQQSGYYEKMPLGIWSRVISELRTVAPLRVLRFFGIGEPLLHPDLARMISEARGIAERTELATNGSLLALRAAGIVHSGLHYLRVSVYSTSENGYELESGSRYRLSEIIDNAREFRIVRDALRSATPHICASLTTSHPEEIPLFRSQWAEIADELRVEIIHNWGGSDSRLVQLASPAPEVKKVCGKPFYELKIKANGDVSACCLEWDGTLKMGNINGQSLREIWNGERAKAIRSLHLSGMRSQLSMCRDCTFIESQPDNLDSLIR